MRLGYFILYVVDVNASVAFYERAFGLVRRFVHESGTYAEMETGATALAFADEAFVAGQGQDFNPNRLTSLPAGAEIALIADDVPAAFARAVASGAIEVASPTQKPWGQTVAYVRDRDGFLVEICSPIGG
jgi:catechol 2,3-dioxygenase-like lactoylglutathione lyase family enzyme